MHEGRMSCREALAELWAFIDHELDTASAEQVRAHLDRCRHCFPNYDFQTAFRAALAAQCRQGCPPELRGRILKEIIEEARRGGERGGA